MGRTDNLNLSPATRCRQHLFCCTSTLKPGLTDIGHVQAVLLGGVVPVGGDGGDVHAVDLPDGRVAAVEVAAAGTSTRVVGTLLSGAFTGSYRGRRRNV